MSTVQMRKSEPLIRRFETVRAEQLALCDELERLADDLGERPDRQRCLELARRMEAVMRRAHAFERSEMFPALHRLTGKGTDRCDILPARLLEQLEAEQEDDFFLVGEVTEALLEFGGGNSSVSPDAIGYLLRGLFVGLRRHLALENETLAALGEV
ncbi:MAG TPA: hemerythrin domain-containing protein [Devosia sp.]|nr:hemerythrin domain-containing protein [Devosia sp.]